MKPLKIEITPFGLTASFYKNLNDNKTKEILVALAGPITSFTLVFLSTTQEAVYSNLLIMIFNLIPIYPLDGGRVLEGILCIAFGEEKSKNLINKISHITIILLTLVSSIAVYYYKNFAIFLICIFLWYLVLQEKNDKSLDILQGK